MIRNLSLSILVLCLALGNVYAQTIDVQDWEFVRSCPNYEMTLQWPQEVKQWVSSSYMLDSSMPSTFLSTVEHEIRSGDTLLTTYETNEFTHQFPTIGKYLIKSIVRTEDECLYLTETSVFTSDRFFVYIGATSDEFRLVQSSYISSWLLLHEIVIEDLITFNDEILFQQLVSENYWLQHADVLIFEWGVFPWFLSVLPKLQAIFDIDFSQTQIIVLSQINSSAFRRLFATYRDLAGIQTLYVLKEQYLGSLLHTLILNQPVSRLDDVTEYTTSLYLSDRWSLVSYLIDYLLYHWIPLSLLVLLLIVPVLVLVVAVCRQIVWLSVYGVFNPLFVAFSLHFLWTEVTLFFFVLAVLSVMIMNILVKRIYLLYTSRIALLVVFYCFLLLAWLTVVEKYSITVFSQQQFGNMFIVFPMVFILLVAYSIFKEKTSFFRIQRMIWFFQFLAVSVLLYVLLRSELLQNILLWYPEVLLWVVVLIVLVWRFTWLQVTEYIRFFPLIRWILWDNDDVEEE